MRRYLTQITLIVFVLSQCLITSTSLAQRKRIKKNPKHAFEAKDFAVSLGTSFLGYSYGYGSLVGGAPIILSLEYGVHRYVGLAAYGGMMYRSLPQGETPHELTVYSAGLRVNGHFYNALDDLVKKADLLSNSLDIYVSLNTGIDYFDTDLPFDGEYRILIGLGFGAKVYPFKSKKLGFMTEVGYSVLTPWLLGATYRF